MKIDWGKITLTVSMFAAIFLMIFGLGCSGRLDKFKLNSDTGKLELVERLRVVGVGKVKGEFETGGKIELDSGLKVPDLEYKER